MTVCVRACASVILVGAAALAVSTQGFHAFQGPPSIARPGATRMSSNRVSSTVAASYVAREGRLVLLVLWRGSPAWLERGGGDSSRGGGASGRTWLQDAIGGVTLDVEIDDATRVATVLGHRVPLEDGNVVLVDRVDTEPAVLRVLHVDPAVPLTPDAMYVVMKREPELVEFLQCDLFRASPLFKIVGPDYLKAWMAIHPCGG
ncbi:MAG TPA: hypothetical protein VFO58_21990 [Vicinamibacterales bacterium]|nr:hypothetical protein [Vicinamibacterales bacterium]